MFEDKEEEKAIEIAEELNIEDFGGSNGCLECFKGRHCLSFETICGEAAAVEGEAIEDWKSSVLKDILSRFDASKVFNLDETGLFYRLLPDKTLSFKGEKCTSGKATKQRQTLLLGANISGNEKLKPLVIGKSKRPRCFKNVKSPPVEYEANSNAWMTTTIWERHIRKLDSQFSRQKRNVAIIVDNCTVHNQLENLKAIEIVFLPLNVTALLQPLDQRIIRVFKRKYKKCLVHSKRRIRRNPQLRHHRPGTIRDFAANRKSKMVQKVNDVNAFVNIYNDIAICSQATVKALASEFLESKQNSSGEDSDVENMDQTPPNKTETIEALEKVRQ
ncbi:Tigger transposable element-derived protein 4 [Araneus ventricosus]|uniref:Tigger transposable element-derived protein 4 n=1 Tax=Araneus ventricosus TaxID=182803 RepID=A0A4Y2BEZ1_ARAVE|nr:Tigger transposable element-derived protein 4 [Araneus ventricosus]